MLQNWLEPIALVKDKYAAHQFGKTLTIFEDIFPDLSGIKVAIIGVDREASLAIRSSFYRLSDHFKDLGIADLGNVRKKEVSFIIPIVKELMQSGIVTILIGENLRRIKVQLQAHQQLNTNTPHWLAIDDRLRLNRRPKELIYSQIGGQVHFMDPAKLRVIDDIALDYVSLGQAKADIMGLEPIVRNADFASFSLSALKFSEAMAQNVPSPSGFFLEDACRILRYVGMSDKLQSLGFYGYNVKLDKEFQTAQAQAQLIWYFIDGVYNRKNDYPASTQNMTEYVVNLKDLDLQLTFWKSKKSGRWWAQLPAHEDNNYLIPCSYEDYKLAGWGELSDRLMNILRRFP